MAMRVDPSQWDMHWDIVNQSTGYGSKISYDGGSSWSNYTFEHSFRFEGTEAVPEPTTMLLFGAGLIGLAGIRRKMRK